MNHFSELQSQHEELLRQENTGSNILENVQTYIEDVRFKSSNVSSSQEREQLRANTRYWASYVYAQTGEFPNTELTPFSGEILEETAVSSSSLPKYIITGIVIIAILSLFAFMIFAILPDGAESDATELSIIETQNAQIAVTNAAITRTIVAMVTEAAEESIEVTGESSEAGTETRIPRTPTPISLQALKAITPENIGGIEKLATLTEHTGAVLDLDFNPNGQQLVSSGEDGTVIVWSIDSANLLSTQTVFQQWLQQSVTYNANGTQIAIGGNDRVVTIINTADNLPFAQFTGHEGFVFGLDYTPDGVQLASGDGNGVLKIWDVYSGGLFSTTTVGKDAIRELDFSPKQEFLAVANATDGFKLLDYPSLRQRCAFSDASALTTAVSDDSTFVVFGTADGLLIRIDPNSRSCAIIDRVQAHKGAVNSVALNENSNMMVSGGEDGVVFITPDGISLTGHTGSVESVAINPAGTLIASASADGTIILWGIPSE